MSGFALIHAYTPNITQHMPQMLRVLSYANPHLTLCNICPILHLMNKTPKELVRERDDHTCKNCGKKWKRGMKQFDVHHLDPEREGFSGAGSTEWDRKHLDRLVTLCKKCHSYARRKHRPIPLPTINVRLQRNAHRLLKTYAAMQGEQVAVCLDKILNSLLKSKVES